MLLVHQGGKCIGLRATSDSDTAACYTEVIWFLFFF
jgi:hypothetical protein